MSGNVQRLQHPCCYRHRSYLLPVALVVFCAASLSFAALETRPELQFSSSRGRRYHLLPTKKLERERELLTQPIKREVAPSVFNPLLDELNGMPRLDKVQSHHLVGAADLVLEQFQSDLTRIQSSLYKKMALKQQRLSYEEVIGPVEVLLDRLEKVWGAINFLRKAWRISPKIDEIYHALSYRVSTAANILAQSEFLHEALRQLSEQELSPVQRRVVMRLAREGFTMGVGIDDAETSRSLEEGTKRLAQLAAEFSENLEQDQAALRSLPQADVSDETSELREEAFRAKRRLGLAGGNLPVIAEMLQLRQDWAATLGYGSFADLVFEARSGSKVEVEMLLQALRESSEAAAVKELQDLKTFASGPQLRLRDIEHIKSEKKKQLALFEESHLEPYLPLTGVIRGLFHLIQQLFGLRWEKATARREVPMWHRSIRFYRLVDVNSQFPIGGLYLDLFQHGKKLGSPEVFWSDSFVRYSRRMGHKNAVRRPIAHIVGALPPPETKAPNLLTLSQVRSLFRAAGQALQHLLNEQEEGLAGPETLEIDANILPTFMERWASEPLTLQSFGGHWETGAAIPEDLLKSMAIPKTLQSLELFQKVSWAQVDLALHSQEVTSEEKILDVVREKLSSEEIASVMPDFNDAIEEGLCSFREPFSTGFAAGFYVELWIEVLVADLFEVFQADGETNISSLGKRMRELLLAPGGANSGAASLVRELRGRGPKVVPFLKQLGLKRRAA